jgi:uncharacterized protein YqgQ
MNSWGDITQLLKRYGVIIYTRDPLDDIALAELELEDMHEMKLIEASDYFKALLILRKERERHESKS